MNSDHRIASGLATLAANVVGTGAPVVFLHANVADNRMWRAQMAGVGENNLAIAYDRRSFGETHAGTEDFSEVADLLAVMGALTDGAPAILVGCSQGGRIAVDAALRYPSRIVGLVLIAPNVTGEPAAVYPPDITGVLDQLKDAEEAGDLDQVNAIKARLWLDGPLASEGRVAGPARQLLLDMNAIKLRSSPTGSDLDVIGEVPAFHRLGEIEAPTLVIWGDLEFPHIQDRCRQIAAEIPNGTGHVLADTAHLPSLDCPAEVTDQVVGFVNRFSDRQG